MIKLLALYFFILTGCLINPSYTDRKTISEEQAEKNPHNADEIRRQCKDYEQQQNIQNSQPAPASNYSVVQEKNSSWSIGDPDALFHIGSNNYKYNHRMNITLICEKNNFLPKKFAHKKIKWKISDAISGEIKTSLNSEANIRFTTTSSDPFSKIIIDTGKNIYSVFLNGLLIFELKPEECI